MGVSVFEKMGVHLLQARKAAKVGVTKSLCEFEHDINNLYEATYIIDQLIKIKEIR
jgi:hypothetical protein